ncbi:MULTISPECIES: BREX-2 system phosphatase PglZ [unclassified Halorhodospira]|uniref:BREX-2 system phosphatase PglZ n=1 Tax=unclassified Halorhodospira TaxID=2626748 RepID=UPI001EE94118|nr:MULTISPECIES: BREX-2 system phosphatase PglZ [unclassified Halorhodospira]MCG5541819.1 BREX-2 system phosphatase PglZ [Halorhodospira sp. M39old]MCG5546898.1 BREX-2 system phosphatase PglZ [Halorhodospira sp. M38]
MTNNQAPTAAHASGATPRTIEARVTGLVSRYGEGVVAIGMSGHWSAGETVEINSTTWPVRQCDSVLSMGLALTELETQDGRGVVLTSLSESDLPEDMLARLQGRRLHRLDPWDSVLALFGADDLDPRVPRDDWLAQLLIASAPAEGYAPCQGNTLDADTVWGCLFRRYLEFGEDVIDAKALLRWLLQPSGAANWQRLDSDRRDVFRTEVKRRAGDLPLLFLTVVESGYAESLLALGLVCEVLFEKNGTIRSGRELAVGRMERYLGGKPLDPGLGARWFHIAREVLGELDTEAAQKHLSRAQSLLDAMQVSEAGAQSQLLQQGLENRLVEFANALNAALDAPGMVHDVEEALARVRAHHLSAMHVERVERLNMALRLLRYLVGTRADRAATKPQPGLQKLSERHQIEHSFVDWARRTLLGSEPDETLGAALENLLSAVRRDREETNKRFAQALADWDRQPFADSAFVGVESVLDRVVAPLAKEAPVLLLVMDGMDYGAYRELEADLTAQGWAAYGPAGTRRVLSGLSTVPSVTSVARTSLLSGEISQGNADRERKKFASHKGMMEALGAGRPKPALYHKASLSEGGADLSEELRKEIANTKRRIIGVVLNAIDDHLAKSDQIRLKWGTEQFRQLSALLEAARINGRTVILTSDHGHVMDWHSHKPCSAEDGRWRRTEGEPRDGEILVKNPAVRAGLDVDSVIVPWSESIRYVRRSNGYHGGVTPQEIVVPVSVLRFIAMDDSDDLPGWEALPEREPSWWHGEPLETEAPALAKRSAPAQPVAPRRDDHPQLGLLEEAGQGDESEHGRLGDLVDQLLSSATYKRQQKAAGRVAPKEEVLRQFLKSLLEADGRLSRKALATTLAMPEFRARTQLAAMQRVLNVDGYAVVREDPSNREVLLDRRLLQKQFDLGEN